MANHQALFCVGGVKGLKEVSQDETSPKCTKWEIWNTNYGGSPSSVLGFVVWRTQRGESGRDFRQNTQNNFFKYQLWRITKLCFVLVVWRDSERRVRTNFRQNTQNTFSKYQLWRISELCFVLVVWRGLREASQEQGAPEKKKQVWRLIQGCFFSFSFFFQFCEIGGLAIVIHKRNLTDVPRNSGAKFRQNNT